MIVLEENRNSKHEQVIFPLTAKPDMNLVAFNTTSASCFPFQCTFLAVSRVQNVMHVNNPALVIC